MMKIGFIDYYLDEWHANNYPAMIQRATGGEMQVALAYALIDSPLAGGRTSAEWSRSLGIPLADSIEQLIEASDALIVLSPDNCEMHERLCQLPLRSGKPTYVDKTFAPDLDTAQRIFQIAEDSGTPCYTTSALRFAAEYEGVGRVQAISAWGPGSFETYAIHQIEPIMMLMKAKAARVMAHASDGYACLNIEFDDGRSANLNCFREGSAFSMNVCLDQGSRVLTVESDFFNAFIHRLVRFFRTKQEQVPHEETLRIMAVRGAGVRAISKMGEWVEA